MHKEVYMSLMIKNDDDFGFESQKEFYPFTK